MTRLAAEPRSVVPGTTRWTADDLDDPRIEREWFRGHYEIIEGVLTTKQRLEPALRALR